MFGLVGLTLHGPFFLKGFQWIDQVCGPKTTITNVRMAACRSLCPTHWSILMRHNSRLLMDTVNSALIACMHIICSYI